MARSPIRSAACCAALGLLLTAGAALAVAEAEPVEQAPAAEEAPAAEQAPAAEEAPAAEDAPAASTGRVARSAFTTAIEGREPVDSVRSLPNDRDTIAYFTELRGFDGHTVLHRWQLGDQVMAEVPFEVQGPRWRVHSTKRLDPSWLGTWSVSVVVDGEVVTREQFDYLPADEAPTTAAGASAPAEPPSESPAPPAAPDPVIIDRDDVE